MPSKEELLSQTIEHIDITKHDVVPLVEAMRHMAFSARDLARAADIYDRMLRDKECGVILCLAGSLISAGLKKDLRRHDPQQHGRCIVSTGANIVDQDFFEALGFKHYIAEERLKSGHGRRQAARAAHRPHLRHADRRRRAAHLRRDDAKIIADELAPRPYSSREFIQAMGALSGWNGGKGEGSIVYEASSTTCRSSARRSPIARPASAWWPISTLAAISPKCPSTAARTSTS